jgi:hypothetical protein
MQAHYGQASLKNSLPGEPVPKLIDRTLTFPA